MLMSKFLVNCNKQIGSGSAAALFGTVVHYLTPFTHKVYLFIYCFSNPLSITRDGCGSCAGCITQIHVQLIPVKHSHPSSTRDTCTRQSLLSDINACNRKYRLDYKYYL